MLGDEEIAGRLKGKIVEIGIDATCQSPCHERGHATD